MSRLYGTSNRMDKKHHEKSGESVSKGKKKRFPSDNKDRKKRDTPTLKEKQLPICLYNICKAKNFRHLIKNCRHIKDKEQLRSILIEERRKENGARPKKSMRTMGQTTPANHSTLFSANFEGSIEATVLADNGTDDSLMPPTV